MQGLKFAVDIAAIADVFVYFGRRCRIYKTYNKRKPQPRLNNLVPEIRATVQDHYLRNNQALSLPKCRTERFRRSFFPAMCYDFTFCL